ncbi:MAG: hypothetical protein ABII00_06415 [Elusimicrobiota bacterium]
MMRTRATLLALLLGGLSAAAHANPCAAVAVRPVQPAIGALGAAGLAARSAAPSADILLRPALGSALPGLSLTGPAAPVWKTGPLAEAYQRAEAYRAAAMAMPAPTSLEGAGAGPARASLLGRSTTPGNGRRSARHSLGSAAKRLASLGEKPASAASRALGRVFDGAARTDASASPVARGVRADFASAAARRAGARTPNAARTRQRAKKPSTRKALPAYLGDAAVALFHSNRSLFPDKPVRISVKSVRRIADHPRFPYYRAKLKVKSVDAGWSETMDLDFRSDGRIAFLTSTWALDIEDVWSSGRRARPPPFSAVQRRPRKRSWTPVDQTGLILRSLPKTVTLSRVMSEKEFALWKEGKVGKIRSEQNVMGMGMETAPKTTFALNYYRFNDTEPYLFRVPKSKLMKLYRRGLLVINTYEDDRVSPGWGIGEEGRAPIGIEVEVIVRGLTGRRAILKEMRRPVRVPPPEE